MRQNRQSGQISGRRTQVFAFGIGLMILIVFSFQNCGTGFSPQGAGHTASLTDPGGDSSLAAPSATPTPPQIALPEAPALSVSGYGSVRFAAGANNSVVALSTTLTVPVTPNSIGTVFLWPGLQPYGANFLPIDNGVLQPVLTWGPSCAPGPQPAAYSTWWVSAQYVNTVGHEKGFTGCQGGPVMAVSPGDHLKIELIQTGQIWKQTVTDFEKNDSVAFQINLLGQAQTFSEFTIEDYDGASPQSAVNFSDTKVTYASADPLNCVLQLRGTNDYVSAVTIENDGLSCLIPSIVLRAQGITVQ